MQELKQSNQNESTFTNIGKKYQIILFPFNNAATNSYLALMTFITYYGGYYLSGSFVGGVLSAAAMTTLTLVLSSVVTAMRIFDGITDPLIGAIIDKTNGRFGKFRPFMIIGNLTLAVSVLFMFFAIRPVQAGWLRWLLFIVGYVIYVLGYTAQTACTKAGQTVITNEPHQRSQFVVWNMVGMIGSIVLVNMLGNGLLPIYIDPVDIENGLGAQYNPDFYTILVPFTVILSAIYTVLALVAIWKKDIPENWGLDQNSTPPKIKDFFSILKQNSQIRWLVFSAGCNKLASTIATSGAVAVLIYYIMMDNYNGLYIPIYTSSFIFMGMFFVVGAKLAGNKGQKRAVIQFTAIAFLFYLGLIGLLVLWDPNNPSTQLSLLRWRDDHSMYFSTNLITIVWVVFFGCGYGAYNLSSEMCIPMIADCTDYETYRSGNYVPGMMGTLFSLIDKFVSSFASLLISVFTIGMVPALNGKLPSTGIDLSNFDYTGLRLSVIICFCLLPMGAWIITLLSMFFYKLSGAKLTEIQAVNNVRKIAMGYGMSKQEAMATWTTIDQVPAEYIPPMIKPKSGKRYQALEEAKQTLMDKIYHRLWGRNEEVAVVPSGNPVPITLMEMND